MCSDKDGSAVRSHFKERHDLSGRLLFELAYDFRLLVEQLSEDILHPKDKMAHASNSAREKNRTAPETVKPGSDLAGIPDKNRSIEWQTDIADAYKKALSENKPMVVLFSHPGCHYCSLLKDGALKDPRVIAMSERAEFVLAEPARDGNAKYMADKLNITGYPTTVVLDAQQDAIKEKGRVTGFFQPDSFVKQLEAYVPPEPKPTPEPAEDFLNLIQSELIDFGSFDSLFGSPAGLPAR